MANEEDMERQRQMIAEEINSWLKFMGYPLTVKHVREWFALRYQLPPEHVVEDIMRRIEQLR
jgi:hypothetical protein